MNGSKKHQPALPVPNCHCLLFVTPGGLPITEYLPQEHEGRQIYGLVDDPTPDKGREAHHQIGSSK